MTELRFDDRVVVITGAGRGIGRAHARLLAQRGAAVIVGDLGARTDGSGVEAENPADAVVAEIKEAGGRAVACTADVSTDSGAVALVEAAISNFGRLDGLVNNAGIIRTAAFTDVPDEEYQRHLDVHYFGALRLCRAAWPHLQASGSGRIVNTISQAMLGNAMMTHYGSSKGAVFGLTRNLAVEGLEHGILVNALAPGAGTRMAEAGADGLSDEILHYMRTSLTPEHVAPVAAYLLHPSNTVTGEVFNVAGGAVNRLAILNTTGITDPNLTIESVSDRFDEIMAITSEAIPQVIPPAPTPVS
ncbi:short-chain dehydrogenase [Rhodococcus sp. 05-340-1]|uniref:SDR family NAD(P)-dependent oxidoreductase n=1 Tax=Nocardiaceae TaxID=85025 RepID=UPI00050BF7F5|nr:MULTISPECIES: SDR family NAD(P)-dependent oxidoreductase [Rhodococcus]OZC87712.1 short-chain dehydrogenase [Rhodococcus sp. 06-412-2C]OZC96363.1 short-chain dehydrogenase [Rhodococcus sp. 06-412-2B]OZD65347.1 short-chain dehydrogenase [Rhodococcus sp. 05-340-2]OZD74607.1 short-chain dehydrogenase [Rhodococcus sp. 05-340-1]OZD86620.1 short-chain dehydrogenase [Rhodococcus sp. 05-339-2]